MVNKKMPLAGRSLIGKARYVLENLTVEPMFAFYTIGWSVSLLTMQNLNLDKACRVNLNYNDTVCTALLAKEESDNYCEEFLNLRGKVPDTVGPDPWRDYLCLTEDAVQEAVTSMAIWKTFIQSFIPAILIPFIGSWTDRRRRRKPAMLVPIIGEIVTVGGFIVCTYFFYQLRMEVSGVIEAVFPAIAGGWMTMYMAVFSYMGDVTTIDSRTLRIGIVNVSGSVSATLGTVVSGILYKLISYYGVFALAVTLHISAFTFGYYLIKNDGKPTSEQIVDKAEIQEEIEPGLIPFLKDFFDVRHIWITLKVAFKKGENNQRMRVILLMMAVVIILGPWQGEMTVMYTFTRLRFNWNELDYSLFLTFVMVINLIGTSITVGIFSHRMKMDDSIIGIISCVSKILAGFIYAFATKTWMIYLAPLVDIANGTSYIAMRSIASKLVPPDELGKLNSVFGMAEAIVPVLYAPMYNAIYQETRQTVPGAFFLVGGALTTPAIFIFLWLYKQHKEDAARQAKADLELAKDNATTSQVATDCDNEKDLNRSTDEVKQETKYNNEVFEDAVSNSKL